MDCFLRCVAHVIKLDINLLKSIINIDPKEIIYPELPAPYCYRGYSPMLVNNSLVRLGYCLSYFYTTVEEYNTQSQLYKYKPKITRYSAKELYNDLLIKNDQIICCSESHSVVGIPAIYNPAPGIEVNLDNVVAFVTAQRL